MTRRIMLLGGISAIGLFWIGRHGHAAPASGTKFPVMHSDAEWRKLLTPAQYAILRQTGTEPPESSPLDHEFRAGRYDCAGCSNPLFSGQTKFDSHTGWPSFWESLPKAVGTGADGSLMMTRTEVHCAHCGGHLGHVFDDGPKPTGLRYCMNGAALNFHLGLV